jgi:hypothetical protein
MSNSNIIVGRSFGVLETTGLIKIIRKRKSLNG